MSHNLNVVRIDYLASHKLFAFFSQDCHATVTQHSYNVHPCECRKFVALEILKNFSATELRQVREYFK